MTYNGTALTHLTNASVNCTSACHEELWYLLNPSTGTNTVNVTTNTSNPIAAGAASFYGVDQSNPFGTLNTTSGSSTSSTVTVNSAANELVVDTFGNQASTTFSPTQGGNQTRAWRVGNASSVESAGSSQNGGASTTTMTWSWTTSQQYADIAVPLNPTASAALTNFPVLISTNDTDLKNYVTNATGYDIIFVDSTETTQLDHEIEKYVSSTGEIEAWVRIPTLSASTDTVIYMYFDNSSITTPTANATGVWDSNFKAVWHMGDNAVNTTVKESTSNGFNGTNSVNTNTVATTGQIDGGLNYSSGSSNYTNVNNVASSIGTGNVTYSFWFKPTSTFNNSSTNQFDLVYLGSNSSSNDVGVRLITGTGQLQFVVWDGSNFRNASSQETSWTGGTWYFVTGTFSTSAGKHLYVNGSSDGSNTNKTRGSSQSNEMGLAHGLEYSIDYYFSGTLDEVRVSNIDRSAGWIATEYNNQNSPSTFETFGSPLQVPENLLLLIPFIIFLPKIIESLKKRRKLRLATRQHAVVNNKISYFAWKKPTGVTKECFPDPAHARLFLKQHIARVKGA